jgi:hypothetical protein
MALWSIPCRVLVDGPACATRQPAAQHSERKLSALRPLRSTLCWRVWHLLVCHHCRSAVFADQKREHCRKLTTSHHKAESKRRPAKHTVSLSILMTMQRIAQTMESDGKPHPLIEWNQPVSYPSEATLLLPSLAWSLPPPFLCSLGTAPVGMSDVLRVHRYDAHT